MTISAMEQAVEAIYEALANDNEDLNQHINALKSAMKSEVAKEAMCDTNRLIQGNREGRKRIQSYFKKQGVKVVFAK